LSDEDFYKDGDSLNVSKQIASEKKNEANRNAANL
jgi:hypothetical protein